MINHVYHFYFFFYILLLLLLLLLRSHSCINVRFIHPSKHVTRVMDYESVDEEAGTALCYLSLKFRKRRIVEDENPLSTSSSPYPSPDSKKKRARITSTSTTLKRINEKSSIVEESKSFPAQIKCKFPYCEGTVSVAGKSKYCTTCKRDRQNYIQASSSRKIQILKRLGQLESNNAKKLQGNPKGSTRTKNREPLPLTRHNVERLICAGCSKPGDVICCVSCPRSYHLHCAGLFKVLKGFRCSVCDPKKQEVGWNHEVMEMRRRLPVNSRFDILR